MQNNIFAGIGIKSQFVKLIYQELMKRDFVSLTDILVLYYQKDKDYYKTFASSKEIGYGELKKAFSDVIRAIEHVCPNSIIDNGKKGKGSAKNSNKVQVMVGFGTGTDPSQIAVHEALAEEFNNTIGKEKDIELEFVTVQYSESEQKFTTLVAADMTPDICGPVGVMGVGKFIDVWLDIRPFLEKDGMDTSAYNEKLVESMKYNVNGEEKLTLVGLGSKSAY